MEHMMCFFFILAYLKKDTALEFSSVLTCIFLLAEQFKPQAV